MSGRLAGTGGPPSAALLRLLATALDYPGETTPQAWEELDQRVREEAPALGETMARFRSAVRDLSSHECQEVYAGTFDVNPARCLYVGYHLFGDSYKRGAFMACLNGEYRARGFSAGAELPDHLCILLRFMADRMGDAKDRAGDAEERTGDAAGGTEDVAGRTEASEDLIADLVAVAIVPALGTIVDQFAGSSNPYRLLLQAALGLCTGGAARSAGGGARSLPLVNDVGASQPELECSR